MTNSVNQFGCLLHLSMLLTVIGAAALSVWDYSIGVGLLAGWSASIVGFRLIAADVSQVLQQDEERTVRKQALLGYLKRYVLYAAVLGFSGFHPQVNFFSTLAGLKIIPISIIILAATRRLSVGQR